MSFIHLSSMGIQSLHIMADSVDRDQMLLTSNGRLDWRDSLYSLVPDPSIEPIVFPNPFASETMLTYELSERSDVRIDIYTVSGVLIHSIVYDDQLPGKHYQKISPDIPSTSSIMILKLTVKNRSQVLKLIKKPL